MAKVITIGSKYEDAFKSICLLTRNGVVDAEVVKRVNEDCTQIETEGHIFKYDSTQSYIRTEQEIGMTSEGATWFKIFRGGVHKKAERALGQNPDLAKLKADKLYAELEKSESHGLTRGADYYRHKTTKGNGN